MKKIEIIKDTIYPFDRELEKRLTVRGVIINDNNEIALLHIICHDLFGVRDHYELPGGGINENENLIVALKREMKEEIGVIIKKPIKIGESAIEYHPLNRLDYSYNYVARVKQMTTPELEDYEKEIIKEIKWVNIHQIINFYQENEASNVGFLIHKRDLGIIKDALTPKIIKVNKKDTLYVIEIINQAKAFIKSYNSPQWQDGFPDYNSIVNSITKKEMYKVLIAGKIEAVFSLTDYEKDYQYIEGKWLNKDDAYLVIHRLAVSDTFRGKGLMKTVFNFIKQYGSKLNYKSIRIDTHYLNTPMINTLEKNGFKYCGMIYLGRNNESRLAYEFLLGDVI